ncbi:MAG: hypothetical protein ACRC46_12735 [Thermoguttaceae bacterium]
MFITQFTVTLLIFVWLASVGLTAILVDGKVFLPLRQFLISRRDWCPVSRFLANILTCYQCCGFWSGIVCGAFFTLIAAHAQAVLFGKIPTFSMEQAGASLLREVPPAAMVVFPNWISVVAFAGIVFGYGLVGSLLSLSYLVVVEWIHSMTVRPQEQFPQNHEHAEPELFRQPHELMTNDVSRQPHELL